MRVENSFIPVRGVGERTERRLWRAGITHWDDVRDPGIARDATPAGTAEVSGDPTGSDDPTGSGGSTTSGNSTLSEYTTVSGDSPLSGVPGVGPTTARRIEAFVEEATDRLGAGDTGYFDRMLPGGERWRLYENFRADACFFDIETTGLSQDHHEVTCVSAHRAGETTTLVKGRDLSRDRLAALLDAPLLVTFNGAQFDVPFVEQSFGLSLDAAHLDLLYPSRTIDLTGGLKAIECETGIGRERPDISGRDAVRLWHEYQRGDDAALETLVSYNREDAANLRDLADLVTERLHDRVFEPARDP